MPRLFALLALVLGASRSLAAQAADTTTAFVDVSVLPMDRERLLEHQTVLVRGDRIVALGPSARTSVPAGARRVDGRGKFLMPGLIDMHAHFVQGRGDPGDAAARQFAMFLATGVTTARGLGAAPGYIATRDRANAGEVLAPTLIVASPSLNGNSVKTIDDARRLVTDAKANGYDLLKTHGGVSREVYDTIVAVARRAGLQLSGHVSSGYGLAHALESRQQVEHLDGYLSALARDAAGEQALANKQIVADPAALAMIDESKIPAVVEMTRRSGTCAGPTLALFETVVSPTPAAEMAKWPEMQFVAPQTVTAWTNQKTQASAGFTSPEGVARFVELRRKIVRALYEAKVPVVVSSDSPQFFLAPGFAVHHEMRALRDAGLPPYAVLEAATLTAARCLGRERELGTLAQGKRADLLLLDSDPRTSLAAVEHIDGVMTRGRWVARAELQAMLTR